MDMVQVNKMSQALKALSDVNRIRILEILATGEYCVTELVERLQIDQPKVSHHLAILRSAGIIKSRRDGRHINYSVKTMVHRKVAGERGQDDVFDLELLSVAFRFEALSEGGAAPAVAPREAAAGGAPAPVAARKPDVPREQEQVAAN